jgi:heme/copper-type cytochrome/quinol oxidase subunit 4
MPSNVAVHTISFRGKAGAIFVVLCCAIVLFVIGFITHGWSFKRGSSSTTRSGLWESCTCSPLGQRENWFHAVQAMMSIGLICLLIAFLLIAIYMCVHTVSKNSTIIALVCVCFISAIFMIVGFIIFAVEKLRLEETLSWSFAITVLSSILCVIAGIISVIQLKSAGVKV